MYFRTAVSWQRSHCMCPCARVPVCPCARVPVCPCLSDDVCRRAQRDSCAIRFRDLTAFSVGTFAHTDRLRVVFGDLGLCLDYRLASLSSRLQPSLHSQHLAIPPHFQEQSCVTVPLTLDMQDALASLHFLAFAKAPWCMRMIHQHSTHRASRL